MQNTGNNATHARLFITRLATGTTPAVVADIFKRTREAHRRLAIGGAMLFDGERFGYGLFGPVVSVAAAVDAVQSDPYQTGMQLLSSIDGAIPAGWPSQGWRCGWTEPDGLAGLSALAAQAAQCTQAAQATDSAPHHVDALASWSEVLGASDLL